MSAGAVIVSIGARTPVGLSAASAAAAVRAGIRRIAEHPFMVDDLGNPIRAARDAEIEPDRLGGSRLFTMARSALGEALEAIGDRLGGARIDVILALPEPRPGFTEANATWLAREVPRGMIADGRPAALSRPGHAGALDAIRDATIRLAEARAELCAVVGVDSYFNADTIDWLLANRQIDGEGTRSGFAPGEAAGCVVLASRAVASTLGLAPLAEIRGVASAIEANRIKGDAEVLGHGLTEAVLGATATLRLPGERADDVYCDLNGERYRTDEWGFMVLRAGQVLRDVTYEAPSTSWGDVGAASGALACVLAARAWARGYARGPRALICGGSEAGLRSAVVIEQPTGG